MNTTTPSYQRHRFLSGIISHAIWLYHRVDSASVRWKNSLPNEASPSPMKPCGNGAGSLARLIFASSRNDKVAWGDAWHLDEVFVSIQGEQQYLWRAVDQDSDTIDILVQRRRNKKAAERFFRRLITKQGREPRWLITDKLKSDDAAHPTMMPTINHINTTYANTRAEVSHQPTRQQEYHMCAFSSSSQAQRFLTVHGLTQNLFRLGRHLIQAVNYRFLRTQAFQVWKDAVCA